ncbi:hypothetical protein FSP39_003686 [Pinctada imbricata]|uniref:Uncharacterized protein n=1 Tax=Pinctada imbricata TaxID=66713 RepID=A0AA88YNZ4_PINIB|nr:hypothetical protein FSP39_003686 [Pinctada imbricata]
MDRKIKVIIWKYTGLSNVGHAALQLSDGTYISWWPIMNEGGLKKTVLNSVEAYRNRTFDLDNNAEDGDPEIVEIPVSQAQEQAVKNWWTGVLANRNEKYNLRTNNCSTIVYRALREAGCSKAKNEPIISPWTPNMVLNYAKQCQKNKEKLQLDEIIEEVVEDYLNALEDSIFAN